MGSFKKTPSEGGSGGRRGHANMEHWGYTDEVKDAARVQRRLDDKREILTQTNRDEYSASRKTRVESCSRTLYHRLVPDRSTLRVGDRIRLLHVPEGDLKQRERELETEVDEPGWTADTIERILAQDPVVTISRIDEYGMPWFDYLLLVPHGPPEQHSLAIMEDDSWERA